MNFAVEKLPDEILEAFKAYEKSCGGKATGKINARELKNILTMNFERLTEREIQNIFREANVNMNGEINYTEFLKIVSAPVPDYY
jgi:Ca2+-binding EF-hand superfamily protein